MPDDLYLRAIEDCKKAFKASLAQVNRNVKEKVTIDKKLIDAFGKRFQPSFKYALGERASATERPGEAAWKITRDALMAKIHAVAGLAASYAREQRVKQISKAHLDNALKLVKPDCGIKTRKVGRNNRRVDYCP